MFHAVAANLRDIVGKKGVSAEIKIRRFAEDGNLFADDLFAHFGELVHFGIARGIVDTKRIV